MSAENIETMNRFLAAVFAGEHDRVAEYVHPDFELIHASTLPYAGVYRGADGFKTFLGIFMGSFEPLDMQTGETFAAPSGSLVVEIALAGTLKATGKRMETTMLEKWDFADGKVIRIKPHYFDPS